MQLKKNDFIQLVIEDMSAEGEGIGKVEGFPFFVKDAIIGDIIVARVTKLKKNYGFGRLEEIVTPSVHRIEPPCAYHKQCGGCQIQAMDYEQQLVFKQNKVFNNLVRIGGFSADYIQSIIEPIVGMENPYRYRNKAQFPVGMRKVSEENSDDVKWEVIAGFYAGRTHHIVANTDCLLGVAENQKILETFLTYMRENHISAYDEETGRGCVRHLLIRKGFASGELMVCVVINADKLPKEDVLIQVMSEIPGVVSLSVSINKENTNVIMGKVIRTLWGKDKIKDTIRILKVEDFTDSGERVEFAISPLSFYQVNPVQTEKLYSLALEYAGLTGTETVWDLYCGIGTISLFLAKRASKVYGVEIIKAAIDDARENAMQNGITNAEFFVGKAEEVLPEFYEKEKAAGRNATADVIVVDPPRKGCDAMCLETILKMQPKRVVYVSCDSATLARDLKILCEGGYELKRVRAVDQFAHTGHVETVVLLSKLKSTNTIEVDLELSELDLTKAESKATYAEIKQYVLDKFGLKVSQLYIAQVKREFGLIERINYNVGEGKHHVPQVTPEKRDAIIDALKYYQMI